MFAFTKLMQAMVASGTVSDPQFYLTTLLLSGDGTNGAQNNTFLDESSNAFSITRNGNTTQGTFTPFSQTGWGNYFNGSSSIDVASNAVLALGTGDFTYEIWLCDTATPPSSSNPSHVIGVNASGGGVLRVYDTGIDFNTYAVGSPVSYSVTRAQNVWYHLAYTRQGTTGRLFYNGTLVATGTDSANYTSSSNFIIGSNPTTSQFYTGYASNGRIVKGTALYTASFTPSTVPLTNVSGTSLLVCQANRFIDNSSNSLALTIRYGTPSIQAFSPFAPAAAYSASVVGGSGYFDGTGDYLTFTPNSSFAFGTNDFTVEVWYYPTSAVTSEYLIDNRNASQTAVWVFSYNWTGTNSGNLYWYNGSTALGQSSGATITNAWNHLVYVRSGTTGSLYINGNRVATQTDSTNYSNTPLSSTIGDRYSHTASDQYAKGYISGMRVVNGTAVYNPASSTITVPTAPSSNITNTKLLLSCTNGGIIDATAKNDLETVGNAQISTTQSKWGGSSMYFDGTGDWLFLNANAPSPIALGSGDFTVEMWLYPNATYSGAYAGIMDSRTSGDGAGLVYFGYTGTANQIGWKDNTTNVVTGTVTQSAWNHVAVVRASGTLKLYINGSLASSGANSTNYTAPFKYIGTSFDPLSFNGYIDDLRITRGYARYSGSTYTQPTSAFALQ